MMEIDTNLLIFLSIALVGAISIYSLRKNHKGDHKQQIEVPQGVKKVVKEGQEDFVEVLRDSASESIAFLQDEVKRMKAELKSKNGTISKLNGLLYGTADPNEISLIEQDRSRPEGSKQMRQDNSSTSEDVVNMRLRLMAEKLKIDPALMQFDVVRDAFRDIAADSRFDEIAAAALRNTNQSATIPQNPNDL